MSVRTTFDIRFGSLPLSNQLLGLFDSVLVLLRIVAGVSVQFTVCLPLCIVSLNHPFSDSTDTLART